MPKFRRRRVTEIGRFLSIALQHCFTVQPNNLKGSERQKPIHFRHSSLGISMSATRCWLNILVVEQHRIVLAQVLEDVVDNTLVDIH